MSGSFAFRTIRLCTKDCLCLYVCPTGATDTEDSIIDVTKCKGCGKCAAACPSGAISMVPKELPPQQPKTEGVLNILAQLSRNKSETGRMAEAVAESTDRDGLYRLMTAVAMSCRLMNEDVVREAGYMLPQGKPAQELLRALIENPPAGFPVETARKILDLIPCNED